MFAPPGPPLPRNHPSPALLAKLYLHVARLYDSSRALFKAHASDPSSSSTRRLFRSDKIEEPDSAEGDLLAGFKRYLKKEALLSQALAHKWLGVDAGENGKGARIGEAISLCKYAQSRLQDMEDGAMREKMKGLGIGKSNEKKKEERKARKGRVERDLEDISAWIKSYTRQNDTVSLYLGYDLTLGLISANTDCRVIDDTSRQTHFRFKSLYTSCYRSWLYRSRDS